MAGEQVWWRYPLIPPLSQVYWVAGGRDGNDDILDSVEEWVVGTDQWRSGTPLPRWNIGRVAKRGNLWWLINQIWYYRKLVGLRGLSLAGWGPLVSGGIDDVYHAEVSEASDGSDLNVLFQILQYREDLQQWEEVGSTGWTARWVWSTAHSPSSHIIGHLMLWLWSQTSTSSVSEVTFLYCNVLQ